MNRVVLYHAACADGYGAAWAAWRRFGEEDTKYLPVRYGQPVPPECERAQEIYILDFSYPLDDLWRLWLEVAPEKLVVIDHHASTEDGLKRFASLIEGDTCGKVIWDGGNCGAVLTWEYLHGEANLPELLRYVDDRDRWVWGLPKSREISAYIASLSWTFEQWNDLEAVLAARFGQERMFLVREGEAILRYQAQLVERHVQTARLVTFRPPGMNRTFRLPEVNAACLQSEIGHALCEAYPNSLFSASYYDRSDGKRCYSLRSIGEFDVSEVAKCFGGGGHRNAAGFEVETPDA